MMVYLETQDSTRGWFNKGVVYKIICLGHMDQSQGRISGSDSGDVWGVSAVLFSRRQLIGGFGCINGLSLTF